MKLFTVKLTDEEREALEAHRVRLGLRSHAETVRALIRGDQLLAVALEEAFHVGPDMFRDKPNRNPWVKSERPGVLNIEQNVPIGPSRPAPGSRLKKPKGGLA